MPEIASQGINTAVNLLELPFAFLKPEVKPAETQLPRSPGVYFVLDENNQLLYIGASNNVRSRLMNNHEKLRDALKLGAIKIAWWLNRDIKIVFRLEKHWIKTFKPPLNKVYLCSEPEVIEQKRLNDKIKALEAENTALKEKVTKLKALRAKERTRREREERSSAEFAIHLVKNYKLSVVEACSTVGVSGRTYRKYAEELKDEDVGAWYRKMGIEL